MTTKRMILEKVASIRPYIRLILKEHLDAIDSNDEMIIENLNKVRKYYDRHVYKKELRLIAANIITDYLDITILISSEKSEWIYDGTLYQVLSIMINGTTPSHFSNINTETFIAMRKEFKKFKKTLKDDK